MILIQSWQSYILGLVTVPALTAVGLVVFLCYDAIADWQRSRCWLCGEWRAWGPHWLMMRLHGKFKHGLAFRMKTRVRKRQLHGMTWWYAEEHGFTREEWCTAVGLPYRPHEGDR